MTVVTALLVKTFILDASQIPTRSMTDVLQPGDFVLVNKFLYGARTPPSLSGDHGPLPSVRFPAVRDPRRGDILMFWLPTRPGPEGFRSACQYVKRCIAGPGDTLVIAAGLVWVNGRALARLEGDTTTRLDVILPRPGETFMLDAKTPELLRGVAARDREISGAESEEWERDTAGTRETGMAAAAHVHTVMNEFYYLLGDRTSLSVDSRHWGLIPRAWVIGTPIAVYWSADPESANGGFWSRMRGIRWSRIGRLIN